MPHTMDTEVYERFMIIRFPVDWPKERIQEMVDFAHKVTGLAVLAFSKEGDVKIEVMDVVEQETAWDRIAKDEDGL